MSSTFINLRQPANIPFSIGAYTTNSAGSQALSSAYTYGSAGAALGVRFLAVADTILSVVYVYIPVISGDYVTLKLEIRNSSNTLKPGSTLLTSETFSPVIGWNTITLLSPPSLIKGDLYFLVFGDSDGDASNNASVLFRGGIKSTEIYPAFAPVTSSDGFATNGTLQTNNWVGVLKFGNGDLLGDPFTGVSNYTSTTLERGLYITGLDTNIGVQGIVVDSADAANIESVKIYSGSTAPGGTALLTQALTSEEQRVGVILFNYLFLANTSYRIVFSFTSATTDPERYEIEGIPPTDVLNSGFFDGLVYNTINNGVGGWTNSQYLFPQMDLLVGFVTSFSIIADEGISGGDENSGLVIRHRDTEFSTHIQLLATNNTSFTKWIFTNSINNEEMTFQTTNSGSNSSNATGNLQNLKIDLSSNKWVLTVTNANDVTLGGPIEILEVSPGGYGWNPNRTFGQLFQRFTITDDVVTIVDALITEITNQGATVTNSNEEFNSTISGSTIEKIDGGRQFGASIEVRNGRTTIINNS